MNADLVRYKISYQKNEGEMVNDARVFDSIEPVDREHFLCRVHESRSCYAKATSEIELDMREIASLTITSVYQEAW